MSEVPKIPPDPTQPLMPEFRMAEALERIAAALERLAVSPEWCGEDDRDLPPEARALESWYVDGGPAEGDPPPPWADVSHLGTRGRVYLNTRDGSRWVFDPELREEPGARLTGF